MNGGDELSLKDVTFLRAIRDINESPERYASTEAGVTPATVTAITEATTLSEDEVAYRLDHPRLGKSGLVKVYEAGPPGDDSAGLNSAKLTEAGESALAEAEDQQASVDARGWQPDESQSEFDDVQEWEPADVENNATGPASSVAASDGGSGAVVTESPSVSEPAAPATTTTTSDTIQAESADDGTVRVDEERLSALESRLDELEAEAESTPQPQPAVGADPERVDALEEELTALRETTESLEESLETAVSTVEELDENEYGALDEKREEQFQSAVKSMVAFHQFATEVLDVRVENYEPAAGHPEAERVEISRNRIGDALGVGQSGGGGGMPLSGGDSDWPSPDEGGGGRVFDGGGDADEAADDGQAQPETESNAPDSGVYPPLGENDGDSPREVADEADDEAESDAPESGVYPPLGSNDEADDGDEADDSAAADASGAGQADDSESGVSPSVGSTEADDEVATASDELDQADPAALGVDIDVDGTENENIRETASEEGHVMEPIRSTGGEELPLSVDASDLLAVREAVTAVDGDDAAEAAEADSDPLPAHLDAETLLRVWSGTVAADDGDPESAGLPAVPMDADHSRDVSSVESGGD